MERDKRFGAFGYCGFKVLIAICLVSFFLQAVLSMRLKSVTNDEVAHLPAGYAYLKTGDFRMNLEHPPLLKLLAALPLLFLNPSLPLENQSWATAAEWDFGRQFLFAVNTNTDQLLFWGRFPLVLLATFFGYIVFRWARDLYGDWGGLIALLLYSFSPNILAHSRLVTTDLGVSGFMLLTMYTLWRYTKFPSLKRIIWAGVTFGLALSSKFTALILSPLIPFLLFRVHWEKQREQEERKDTLSPRSTAKGRPFDSWYQPWIASLGIFALALGVIALVYGPNPGLLLYKEGVNSIYKNHQGMYEFFLMGNYSLYGWWYYYFVAFALKSTLPLLLLLGLSLLFLPRQKVTVDLYFLILPVLTMFIVSMLDTTNIGLRRILPVYPFLFVFCGSLAQVNWAPKWRNGIVGFLCLWQVIAALRIYPDYLAYFNELTGGPDRGIMYLDDSNIDWGQDLKRLQHFIEEHRINRIKIDYFGMISPEAYGIVYEPVTPRDILQPEKGVYYAISAHNLQRKDLIWFPALNLTLRYDWLEKYTPIKKIGYSIYIYKF